MLSSFANWVVVNEVCSSLYDVLSLKSSEKKLYFRVFKRMCHADMTTILESCTTMSHLSHSPSIERRPGASSMQARPVDEFLIIIYRTDTVSVTALNAHSMAI